MHLGHRLSLSGRQSRAFTLVEMLVVISILILLGGLILGALSVARRQAKVKGVENTLTLLKSALERYQNDFQDYPPSDGDVEGMKGAANLYACLTTEKKDGPYIPNEIRTVGPSGQKAIVDEFGNAIRYIHHRDYASKPPNKRGYRLISCGPDGAYEAGAKGSDDIVNWNKDNPGEK